MGQLVVQEFVTADGFAANSNNEFNAFEMLEGGTAEFDRSQLPWLDTVDAMVLGASTYRMFVEFWPTPASAGEVIAPALNSLRRFVFSRSLKNAPWGSLTLSEPFFAAGEVDAVRLVVMPIAIGAGRGVFPACQDPTLLSLRSAKTTTPDLVEPDYAVGAGRSGG